MHDAVVVFSFAILQALLSTTLSILLALPIAHFFYRFDFPLKRLFVALASMLCIMPTKIVVLCITLFYGATGFTGIILAHLMLNLPFVLYIIGTTYEKIDTTLLWLAADLGATPWRCYKDIIFPLLRPSIVSIALLLFLLHFSSFSIPLLLGGELQHNTPEIMMYQWYNNGNNFLALGYWVLRLLIILPLFIIHNRFSVQGVKISSLPKPVPREIYSPRKYSIWWFVYCGAIAVALVGPIVALLYRAFSREVFSFFGSIFGGVVDATLGIVVYHVIINSVLLAVVSGIGSVLLGFLIGSLEMRMKSKVGNALISFFTVFAFIVGSVGCGIIFAGLSYGKFFSSFAIGVLAHMFLNYAFAYRIIRAQLVLYHNDLHKTAQTCGATLKKAVWTVALPFVFPALCRAFCVSFGLSLTEVGAGAVLQGKIGLTLPMAIRMYRKAGNEVAVIGLSLILLGLAFGVAYGFMYKDA